MTQTNMRRLLKQPNTQPAKPSLRMADGGQVSPWSLKGMAGAVSSAFADTPEQAKQKALVAQYKAEKAAAAAAAPAPAPAPAPTAGVQGYVANGALARREAAAGLRDGGPTPVMHNAQAGGVVPGNPADGDKTKAKLTGTDALLTGGEFVVSNDMLNAQPGLREELHGLRSNVLAAKGKTVEEADAQAVSGKTLRANEGFMPRTRGGLRDTGIEMSQAWDEGKYAKAAGKLAAGTLGLVKNVPDDVIGGFGRGAYGLLRNPTEDFARGALGMEDRKPPAATPAPTPSVPAPIASSVPGSAPAPQSSTPATSPLRTQMFAAGSPQAVAASKKIDSGMNYIPGSGQGMLRNSRGDVTQIDTSGDRYAPTSQGTLNRAYAPTDYSREDAVRNAPSLAVLPSGQSLREERPGKMSLIEEVRYNTRRKQDDRARGLDIQENANNMNNRATLRGQDLNYGSTTRGQDLNYGSTLRGQDLDYGSKLASNKVAVFNALREQGNKDRDFRVGRSDKNIEQAGKFDEQARGAFKNKFDSVDKDGKLVSRPDLEAAAYDEAVRQSNGRWSQLTPAQRAEYLADAFDHVKLLSSARNHQNNSIWQAVGLANKDAAHGGMPSKAEMQGAKLTELGLIDGASTMNAGRGDYKLTLKNGQVMHFGRGDLSQAQLKRLQDLGATLGDK